MFVKLFTSGTNVQRLAKCSKKVDGVIYTSYSQLEKTEDDIVRRKFFCAEVDALRTEVEKIENTKLPSWVKIWGWPRANRAFIGELLVSLVGDNTLRPGLNLSAMMDEKVNCFMLLVSANKKGMEVIKEIADDYIPEWHVKVLNGDYTTNRKAEEETLTEINIAKRDKKKGVLIIANQMGSRSYSVSEIQATVIAFDRGSVDATMQKVSRCLTPGKKYDGKKKEYGGIVDLSFDPNRAENIEKIILEEAIMIHRSGEEEDFTSAALSVLSSVNMFKLDQFGHFVPVSEEDLFKIYGDNEALLKVADISVDIKAALESGIFDILLAVKGGDKKANDLKKALNEGVINFGKGKDDEQNDKDRKVTDKAKKNLEEIINRAVRALNMSATSVYNLSGEGDSYRDCLEIIEDEAVYANEFKDLFGISPDQAITLLNQGVLNEAILDVIVQNSKPKMLDNLFT